jgi:hypothetical protein
MNKNTKLLLLGGAAAVITAAVIYARRRRGSSTGTSIMPGLAYLAFCGSGSGPTTNPTTNVVTPPQFHGGVPYPDAPMREPDIDPARPVVVYPIAEDYIPLKRLTPDGSYPVIAGIPGTVIPMPAPARRRNRSGYTNSSAFLSK